MTINQTILITIAAALLLALTSCAQITYNATIPGENNKVNATGAVDKTTDDLLDLAGSAYGDAATRQGGGQMTGFLQDGQGNNSSLRLVFFLAMAAIIGIWAKVSWVNNLIEPLPPEVVTAIGLFITGKLGQKWVETNSRVPSSDGP